VRGHTFLENDTNFSQIEKQKKRAPIYLPEEWFKVVQIRCKSEEAIYRYGNETGGHF